jgi:uncharacterized coiled-coil protein SlyX
MNLEERIIELLAEYLKKGDQLTDRADRTERGIEIMSRALAENDVKFNVMNEKFNEMNEKFNATNEKMNEKFNVVSQEIKQLREDQNSMREEQSVLLKELISLSKRVAVVEEKH